MGEICKYKGGGLESSNNNPHSRFTDFNENLAHSIRIGSSLSFKGKDTNQL